MCLMRTEIRFSLVVHLKKTQAIYIVESFGNNEQEPGTAWKKKQNSLFLNLYAFFWVITRRLDFIFRRFGTLCLFHLHRQVDVSRKK